MEARTLLVVPACHDVGLTSVCLGLLGALDRAGVRVGFCKPLAQRQGGAGEPSPGLVKATLGLSVPDPIPVEEAERLLADGEEQVLLERVVERCGEVDADIVVVEGLVPVRGLIYSGRINQALARSLGAEVLFVGSPAREGEDIADVVASFDIAAGLYGQKRGAGCVINRCATDGSDEVLLDALRDAGWPIRAAIPLRTDLSSQRVGDISQRLGFEVLADGQWDRRVERIAVGGRNLPGGLNAFEDGSLVLIPFDRSDLICAAALSSLSGQRLAGMVITCGQRPDDAIWELVRPAVAAGLPVMLSDRTSIDTVDRIRAMDASLPADDVMRAQRTQEAVAGHFDRAWVRDLGKPQPDRRITPPEFRHLLRRKARALAKRIVLPEGEEPRTVAAALIAQERGFAKPVLIGNPDTIRQVALDQGLSWNDDIEIVRPEESLHHYVEPMVELRRHKGLDAAGAAEALTNPITLGTMMLQQDEVDGLVAGAIHTTADTLRPALQLIKTAEGAPLVSSVFFMCLPDQVLVYGDCAVNPDPTAEQLAHIAVQSARSAAAFGIHPRVSMISYSTGTSGSGVDVDKVRAATSKARDLAPDLAIDGPMQYDAATNPGVAASKMPDSAVAGRATVFVFPDLNTGNTTYKAVQRSADVVSMGPMLQGLAKPVNDLSRGALVEDIVYTIALTAIQAGA
ncbi:MAG: phosphate acetyltransferase [Planctomycetota bacterium]|jgi:phosphate acetyltransferase